MAQRYRHDDYDRYRGDAMSDHRYAEPTSRRHKSDRRSRHQSPSLMPGEEMYASQRNGHSAYRAPPEPANLTMPPASRWARSPPRYHASESLPREPRRDGLRETHHSRHDRDAPRDYYDRDYEPGMRDRPRRPHRDELEHRPRHERASSPPLSSHRPRARDSPDHYGHSQRSRRLSPSPRSHVRGYHSPAYPSDDDRPRRGARSQERSYKRAGTPPRGRDYGAHASRTSAPRRQSVPAPMSNKKKQQWWQNPLVQAGARTAFSAGAQAAMQNRNSKDPWLGSKGAKVATAALGAALMDSMGGRK